MRTRLSNSSYAEHGDEDDDGDDGPPRKGREDAQARPEKGADVGQDVREAGKHREGQGVLHAAGLQQHEREDRHQERRCRLPSDVRADDRLEVHRDAGEPDVVRAGNDGKEPSAQPVAVDEDVERRKRALRP